MSTKFITTLAIYGDPEDKTIQTRAMVSALAFHEESVRAEKKKGSIVELTILSETAGTLDKIGSSIASENTDLSIIGREYHPGNDMPQRRKWIGGISDYNCKPIRSITLPNQNSDGDDLIIWSDPKSNSDEVTQALEDAKLIRPLTLFPQRDSKNPVFSSSDNWMYHNSDSGLFLMRLPNPSEKNGNIIFQPKNDPAWFYTNTLNIYGVCDSITVMPGLSILRYHPELVSIMDRIFPNK